MLRTLGILCLCLCLFIACSTPEEEKKMDLEAMKDNRDGLDYRTPAQDNFFSKLDEILQKWHVAQKKRDFAGMQYLGNELEEIARGNFSELIQGIDTPNANIAVAALGFSNDPRAIPYLNQALLKGNDDTRNNAALALGNIGSNQTPMDPLLHALEKDPQDTVRAMSAFAISQIVQKDKDEGTLAHLLRSLKDPFFMVRNHVVIALDKIGNPEAYKAITAVALADEHPLIRYHAVCAIAHSENKEFCPHLIPKLEDSSEDVRNVTYALLKEWSGKDFGQDIPAWKKWAGVE